MGGANLRINKKRGKYSNIKRYREIWKILSKYGFTLLAEKMERFGPVKRLFLKKSTKLVNEYTRSQRIRLAIEELGPTFVKLGQILSTRYDIIPKDIVEELSYLQDKVKSFDWIEAERIFKEELNMEIDDMFMEFDKEPIAAASIGQVYKGKLHNGDNVVVKVQRPNIDNIINKDLEILYKIGNLIDEHFNKKKVIRFTNVIKEFSYFIKRELDYRYEAQNCNLFRENFKENDNVVVPKIYWDYTTKKILVMEEVKGIKVSNLEEIDKRGWDREKLAEIGASVFMEQIFIYSFFHGDPHPGNIIILDEKKISFIDFGIVGYIDKTTLNFIVNLLRSSSDKNIDKMINSLKELGAITEETDEVEFRKELYYIVNYYYNIPLQKIKFSEAINEVLTAAYKHKLKIPSQLTLLMKSIITIEGTGKKLNPKFNFAQISKKTLRNMSKKKLKPKNIMDNLFKNSWDSIDMISNIPSKLNNILDNIEKNKVEIKMKQEGFEHLEKEINTMTNRISLSLLVSALVVGSSIVIQTNDSPKIMGLSVFGLVGYVSSAILGIGLVLSILINIRRKNR